MKITDPELLAKLKEYTRKIAHEMNRKERAELAKAKALKKGGTKAIPKTKAYKTTGNNRTSRVRDGQSKYRSGQSEKSKE